MSCPSCGSDAGRHAHCGAQPEAERYVALYRPDWEHVFEVHPGITDPASLVVRDEESRTARGRTSMRSCPQSCLSRSRVWRRPLLWRTSRSLSGMGWSAPVRLMTALAIRVPLALLAGAPAAIPDTASFVGWADDHRLAPLL